MQTSGSASACARGEPEDTLWRALEEPRVTAVPRETRAGSSVCGEACPAMTSGPFYRAAGLTFLRYANISADLLRNVLKEPFKSKAQARSAISYRYAPYDDGKAGKTGEQRPSRFTTAALRTRATAAARLWGGPHRAWGRADHQVWPPRVALHRASRCEHAATWTLRCLSSWRSLRVQWSWTSRPCPRRRPRESAPQPAG